MDRLAQGMPKMHRSIGRKKNVKIEKACGQGCAPEEGMVHALKSSSECVHSVTPGETTIRIMSALSNRDRSREIAKVSQSIIVCHVCCQ